VLELDILHLEVFRVTEKSIFKLFLI